MEQRNKAHFKIANISVFIISVWLGFIHLAGAVVQEGPDIVIIGLMGFVCIGTPILLLIGFNVSKDHRNLAIYVPGLFFLAMTVMQTLQGDKGWDLYYLPLCLMLCVISCLYDNFNQSLIYALLQNVVLGIMTLQKVPFMGPDSLSIIYFLNPSYEGIPLLSFGWFASVLTSFFTLIVFWYLLYRATEAVKGKDSFRTLLDTTPNYIAMVDGLNCVTNVSKTMASLANLRDPEWAIGRPVLDLFPSVQLKEMAGDLLRKKIGVYEEMWEFVLNGEHRYFKALGDDLPGENAGILINLSDMTHLAERDEIAAMKDSLNIGLFFMDRNFIIQDNYSKAMSWMLGVSEFHGVRFTDLLEASVTPTELAAIQDYFGMLFDRQFDQAMLDDINPLNEFHYVSTETKERKILHIGFISVERGHGEVMLMSSIYDITAKIELQKKLAEEEKLRQEEMRSLFELINVEPRVFSDFIEDAEYEFQQINKILKNNEMSSHEALVEIYQSVHAIKSNAVILGLATFGEKVHMMETLIKEMREKKEVPFDDMLHLTLEIERLVKEKNNFRVTIGRINSFKSGSKLKSNDDVLIEALIKASEKASSDLNKKVQFVVDTVDASVMEHGPRRVMKEVLMQLVRNSVVHGIENPEERLERGKSETGSIRLSIKVEDNMIHIKLKDDGNGLDFDKIREKALKTGFFKDERDAQDKNHLLQAIFSPGFSTAATEGVHAGRGIGLNLVRDRVKELNGTLKVQTEHGKGTAFHVYIPLPPEVEQKAS
jgi:two-component system chemotaxis sensor kinase CheA